MPQDIAWKYFPRLIVSVGAARNTARPYMAAFQLSLSEEIRSSVSVAKEVNNIAFERRPESPRHPVAVSPMRPAPVLKLINKSGVTSFHVIVFDPATADATDWPKYSSCNANASTSPVNEWLSRLLP